MGRIGAFVMGVIVGGALVFGGQRYHVVRANDGFHLVSKTDPGFGQTYVDIRNFGVEDWPRNPALAAALIRGRKEDLMSGSAAESFRSGVRTAVERLSGETY